MLMWEGNQLVFRFHQQYFSAACVVALRPCVLYIVSESGKVRTKFISFNSGHLISLKTYSFHHLTKIHIAKWSHVFIDIGRTLYFQNLFSVLTMYTIFLKLVEWCALSLSVSTSSEFYLTSAVTISLIVAMHCLVYIRRVGICSYDILYLHHLVLYREQFRYT